MRIRRQNLVGAVLGLAILGAAFAAGAALIFDGLSRDHTNHTNHTIQILRQGQVVTSVSIPPGAALQIDAASVSHDKANNASTFRGNVKATVKLAEAVVFWISTKEMRLVIAN